MLLTIGFRRVSMNEDILLVGELTCETVGLTEIGVL